MEDYGKIMYTKQSSRLLLELRSSPLSPKLPAAMPRRVSFHSRASELPPLPRASALLLEMSATAKAYLETVQESLNGPHDSKAEGKLKIPDFLPAATLPLEAAAIVARGREMAQSSGDRQAAAATVAPLLLSLLREQQSALSSAVAELEDMKAVLTEAASLQQEVTRRSAELRHFARGAHAAEELLQGILGDHKEILERRRKMRRLQRQHHSEPATRVPEAPRPPEAGAGSAPQERQQPSEQRNDLQSSAREPVPAAEQRGGGATTSGTPAARPAAAKQRQREAEDAEGSSVVLPVSVAEVLAVAQRVSYATYAPPDLDSGAAPVAAALPPAPQDEQLRASVLYRLQEGEALGVSRRRAAPPPAAAPAAAAAPALGAVPKEEQEGAVGAPGPAPAPAAAPAPAGKEAVHEAAMRAAAAAAAAAVAAGRAPGGALPAPPPGWRPGDPLPPLPVDLAAAMPPPPMPQGWRPGDPVPVSFPSLPGFPALPELPAAIAAAVAGPFGSAAGQGLVVPPAPAAPGTFQVAHVQLDLNPGMDSDESDYDDEESDEE